MKNQIASLYEQILLNEAEKSALQNPSNNEVGKVKNGQDVFGSKPELTDTGKNKGETPKTLDRKVTNPEDPEGDEAEGVVKKSNVSGQAAPSTSGEVTAGKSSKPKGLGEEFTMGAFEALFRKTLVNENEEEAKEDEDLDLSVGTEAPSEDESSEKEEVAAEEEEEDLLTDLRKLQTHVTDIITKLEQAVEDEEGVNAEEGGYNDEDFNQEFGEEGSEEEAIKGESLKVLPNSKGKTLQGKNNNVGSVKPKGGKTSAETKNHDTGTGFKVLGDKKKPLVGKNNKVNSSIKKGDSFIK